VLPGTGGLTRVVDKRKVRRDLADAFSTLAEGVKGKRAVEWGLVDAVVPRSKFADTIAQRARDLAAKAPQLDRGPGIQLDAIDEYRHVCLKVHDNTRTAELIVRARHAERAHGAARPADVSLECARARRLLGWSPRPLDTALRESRATSGAA